MNTIILDLADFINKTVFSSFYILFGLYWTIKIVLHGLYQTQMHEVIDLYDKICEENGVINKKAENVFIVLFYIILLFCANPFFASFRIIISDNWNIQLIYELYKRCFFSILTLMIFALVPIFVKIRNCLFRKLALKKRAISIVKILKILEIVLLFAIIIVLSVVSAIVEIY